MAGALLALAVAAAFALHSSADRLASPAALASGVGIAVALGLAAVFGLPRRAALRSLSAAWLALSAAAGVTAVAAPYIVSAYRYSDAPSGSVVVFVTTSLWGLLAVLAASVLSALSAEDPRGRMAAAARVSGGLLAAVGGAGILANWERPSSFNPIVRFGMEQELMLLAGGLWVAGLVVVALAARRGPLQVVGAAYAAGALAASAALLPFGRIAEADLSVAVPYAAVAGLATVLAVWIAAHQRADVVGPALVLSPVLLSALTIVEQITGMLGPRPLQVTSVVVASGLVVLGAAAALAWRGRGGPVAASETLARAGRLAAALAVALALVAMVAFALRVTVHGLLANLEEFDLTFRMRGFESLGPWLALAAAALALGAWYSKDRLSSAVRGVGALAAAVASVAPLGGTPMHTWVTWIPPEVQQDYGTEYAYIIFERLPASWLLFAGSVTLVSILLLARWLLFPSRVQEHPASSATEARG